VAITFGVGSPETGADAVALKVGALFGERLGLDVEWSLDVVAASTPHRAFHCGLEEACRDVLERATFTGWRYLVLRGEQAMVEATVDGGGRVVSAAISPALRAEYADLRWLVDQPDVRAGDFEVCYLRVPSGVLRAWWLVSATGDHNDDLILSVQPSHPTLRGAERVCLRAAEVRGAVARIAAQRIEQGRILVRGVPGLGS
jgi:hypothetical protein